MLDLLKDWDKESKIVFFGISVLGILSISAYLFFYFAGIHGNINWEFTNSIDKLRVAVENFSLGIFDFPIEADVNIIFQQFKGGNSQLFPLFDKTYFVIITICIIIIITTLTFLNNWLYYFGITLLLSYFIIQQPDILFFGNDWAILIQICPVLVIGGGSYLFFAFFNSTGFVFRFFSLLFATAVYYFSLIYFSQMPESLLVQMSFGAIIITLISLMFIVWVGFEIIYFFLYLISTPNKGINNNGTLHFCIISALFLLNLILQYLKNTRQIEIEIFTISPFFILIIAAILGIWGFKERSVMFSKILPFYPFGGVVYLAWGVICFATISHYLYSGNDPMVEVFEDFILYSQIGFSIAFFMYVLGSYSRWMSSATRIHKLVYSFQWVSFWFVYGLGFLIMFALISYSNLFVWNQFNAGYNNGIADAYLLNNDKNLALEYYKKASGFEFQNHKSNYALATLWEAKGKFPEAISYYKKATLKQPSEYAFTNLSALYLEQGKTFEAIFTLKNGIKEFPKSSALHNNLGILFKEINFADSAIIYLTFAERFSKNQSAAAANKLGIFIKNKIETEIRNDIEYLPYQTNVKAYQIVLNKGKNESKNMVNDTILNDLNFSFLNNYALSNLNTSDTILYNKLNNLSMLDTNIFYKQRVEYLKSLINYYTQNPVEAVKSVDNLQLGDEYEAGFYLNTIGLWTLQNGAYRFAADIFEMAYQKGSKTSLINKAMALIEAGYEKDAIQIFNLEELKTQIEAQNYLQKLSKLFSFQSINQVLLAEDEDKYIFLHYRLNDLNESQLGNIFFSIKSDIYIEKAGVELFHYYYESKDSQKCSEIIEHLQKHNSGVEKDWLIIKYYILTNKFDELANAIDKLEIPQKQFKFKPFLDAKIAEFNKKDASQLYIKASKSAPFDKTITLEAAKYLQEKALNSSASFNVLLDAVSLNPYEVELWKAYCLQAINYGIPSFADNGLMQLKKLASDKEFNDFKKFFESYKASMYGN